MQSAQHSRMTSLEMLRKKRDSSLMQNCNLPPPGNPAAARMRGASKTSLSQARSGRHEGSRNLAKSQSAISFQLGGADATGGAGASGRLQGLSNQDLLLMSINKIW